jgi:dual specificity phosphatase 12
MESANANLILPGLWLGNRKAAADTEFLTKNNITCVFNCTKDIPFHSVVRRQYRVPVDDNLQAIEIYNMERWAPEIVYKLTAEYKAGNQILVHCHAGMQRSAAVVAMMMIAVFRKSADDVMTYIRERRQIAFFPAANFDKAIRGFEARFVGASKTNTP